MSNKHRDKPKPPEVQPTPEPIPETVPEVQPTTKTRPELPPIVLGMARAVKAKWGVPEWLTHLASWTGSKFHTATPGTNNAPGIMATGTMQKNAEGWAWFGNIPISYDQFGQVCNSLGLDYSDPKGCVEKLKARCPKIDTVSYTIFTEAK